MQAWIVRGIGSGALKEDEGVVTSLKNAKKPNRVHQTKYEKMVKSNTKILKAL